MLSWPSSRSWIIRYKLYHIPFWYVYHYVWWSITIGSPLGAATGALSSPYGVKNLFYVLFQALGVYFNLYYLVPVLLERGKNILYIFSVLLTMIVVASIIVTGYYFSSAVSGKSMMELYQAPGGSFWRFFQVNTFPSTVASMTLAMCVKFTKNWMQAKQRSNQLEQEKLQTELKFLRSQFNPHFLFNTINSIFVLIHKNPDKASESLAKFSELLRYQLYECNEQQIPVQQEIGYLQNFIALEKLRQEKELQVLVDVCIPANNLLIAPFMLVPFVENAFKHVSLNKAGEHFIDIRIALEHDELVMVIRNSVSGDHLYKTGLHDAGGLGLKNIERRLMLLYQGRHQLDVTRNNETYTVSLRVCLEQQQSLRVQKPVIA